MALSVLGASTLLASAGCGGGKGSGSGTSSNDGNVGGVPFQASEAVSTRESVTGSGSPAFLFVNVFVSDTAGVCGAASLPASGAILDLEVDSTADASGPGTYPIDNTMTTAYYFADFSSACQTFDAPADGAGSDGGLGLAPIVIAPAAVFHYATGGSVTLTTVNTTTTDGSFDVTFETGDRLTGTFTAPTCTQGVVPACGAGDGGA